MLTATDIHYLVGLLTLVYDRDAVDIELGNMVWDQAEEKNRDIDVTVTYKLSDGTIGAFRGLEVKDHSRPLTVEQVEQLVIKFQDMPEITHRAIVSASGYTKGAVKKALYHGVDLIEFATWEDRYGSFDIKLHKEFQAFIRDFHWEGIPKVIFICDPPLGDGEFYIDPESVVYDKEFNSVGNLRELATFYAKTALDNLTKNFPHENPSEKFIPVHITVKAEDKLNISVNGQKIAIEGALIDSVLTWNEVETLPIFKMLVKHGEAKPYIGCAISELPNGNLFAITLHSRELGWVNVSVNDRLKQKIYRHKLK